MARWKNGHCKSHAVAYLRRNVNVSTERTEARPLSSLLRWPRFGVKWPPAAVCRCEFVRLKWVISTARCFVQWDRQLCYSKQCYTLLFELLVGEEDLEQRRTLELESCVGNFVIVGWAVFNPFTSVTYGIRTRAMHYVCRPLKIQRKQCKLKCTKLTT